MVEKGGREERGDRAEGGGPGRSVQISILCDDCTQTQTHMSAHTFVCMHVGRNVCMSACMYMHAFMHGCMYGCMHGCLYGCMHGCMYGRMDV